MASHIRDTGKQLVTDPQGLKDPVEVVQHLLNEKCLEFISLCVDDKLCNGLKGFSEEDVEVVLDKAITLFWYLQGKDIFEKYHVHHRARRLLSGKTRQSQMMLREV